MFYLVASHCFNVLLARSGKRRGVLFRKVPVALLRRQKNHPRLEMTKKSFLIRQTSAVFRLAKRGQKVREEVKIATLER